MFLWVFPSNWPVSIFLGLRLRGSEGRGRQLANLRGLTGYFKGFPEEEANIKNQTIITESSNVQHLQHRNMTKLMDLCHYLGVASSGLFQRVASRLLYPQHLNGIWTGPLQFRLPYDTLSKYPEPWF